MLFLSGIVSGIGGAISGIAGSIGGALSSIGGSLLSAGSSFLGTVSPFIGKFISAGLSAVPFIGPIMGGISLISSVLGLFRGRTQTIEDYGLRASYAYENGINREDFDTYDEYLDKLNEFEIDKSNYSDSELRAAQILGASMLDNEIKTKIGSEINVGAYTVVGKINEKSEIKIDPTIDQIKKINTVIKDYSINLDKIEKYENNEMRTSEKSEFEEGIDKIIEILGVDIKASDLQGRE